MIKEKPILFNDEMVRAVLDRRKTQTRRIITPTLLKGEGAHINNCPFGRVGDRLWVKEAWQTHCDMDHISPKDLPEDADIQYPATYDGWVSKKRRATRMPRWASRITLEITGIRIERLQDVSETDARAEGVSTRPYHTNHIAAFKRLWALIKGADSWAENPWVWVVEFKREDKDDETE